jgi:hypothetical protein
MGKYKKGDIVVCTEIGGMGGWVGQGEICVLGGKHWDERDVNHRGYLKAITQYYPKGGGCSRKTDFRHATPREVRAYQSGIFYASDIKESESYDIY